VEVNNMWTEYGRSSAGVVNGVTKGVTNSFHGSVYEFLRNNFGLALGGPSIRNRTFYFYNYDGHTPQFDLPNQVLGGGEFGAVTAAGGRRIMQMGLKLYW